MKHLVVVWLIFAGWAVQTPAAEAQSGIEGSITLSPAHGGPSRVGVPDSKPLANAEFVVEDETGKVAEFATDDAGRFRIALPPGHYTVSLKNKKRGIGENLGRLMSILQRGSRPRLNGIATVECAESAKKAGVGRSPNDPYLKDKVQVIEADVLLRKAFSSE